MLGGLVRSTLIPHFSDFSEILDFPKRNSIDTSINNLCHFLARNSSFYQLRNSLIDRILQHRISQSLLNFYVISWHNVYMVEIKEMGTEKKSKTLKKEVLSLSASNRYGKVNFRCTKRKNHGDREYRLVAQPKNEKRIDLLLETEVQARQYFYKWQSENNPCGMNFRVITTTLSDEQLRDATQAFDRIPDGVTLSDLITQYELKKEVTSISLQDAWEKYRILNTWTPKNRDGRWTKNQLLWNRSTSLDQSLKS